MSEARSSPVYPAANAASENRALAGSNSRTTCQLSVARPSATCCSKANDGPASANDTPLGNGSLSTCGVPGPPTGPAVVGGGEATTVVTVGAVVGVVAGAG